MIKIAVPSIAKMDFPRLKNGINILKKSDRRNLTYMAMSLALSSAKVMGNLTPFGTGFFFSVCNAKNLIPSLIGVGIGSILTHQNSLAMCYVLASALCGAIKILWDKPISTPTKSTISAVVLFVAKTIASAKGGLLIYDTIINFSEALLCALMVMASDKAMPILMSNSKRTCLNLDETVSVVCVLASFLMAFNTIPPILDIKLGNVLGIALILIINLNSHIPSGAVVGIVIGAVNCIGTYNAGSVIGAYSFSSLISALFRKQGKTAVILSFVLANAIITILLNDSTEVLISIYEILWASVIVFALPNKFCHRIVSLSSISATLPDTENGKIRSIYQQQLSKIAESVSILSKNMPSVSRDELAKKELSSLVNRTAQRVCSDCSLRYCCWQKKGSETKKSILHMLSAAQSHGKAYINDIDDQFKNRCIRTENLLRAFNDSYEFYRMNIMWQKRLCDSKSLSCMQMGSVAKILDNMATEKQNVADADTIKQIKTSLDGQGIVPENISAYFKDGGNLIVELRFPLNKYREDTKFIVAPCISDALGIKMRFNEICHELNHITLTYSMCERFRVACGGASISKHGETVCGDSFATLSLSKGTFIAAISDGMGSGETAKRESKNTIELLKNFLRCGFDIMHATRLVNSSMLLSATDEVFSTIDLCSINLHTGIADFVKIGGASTYIKNGSAIEKLSSPSLPAGIIDDLKVKHFSKKLDNDSLIIMVSDGVENASSDDKWLEKKLAGMDSLNPHIIADKILELSLYYSGGKAKDDMTVIAMRVFQENNV